MGCDAIWCKKWITHLLKVVTKVFRAYIDLFMKIFLNDFMVFSDLLTHLESFLICFYKCREFGISLNLNNYAFMVFSKIVLGFIMSKEARVMDPKNIEA